MLLRVTHIMDNVIRRTKLTIKLNTPKIKIAAKYFFCIILFVALITCEKESTSPFDPETSPSTWTPTEFTGEQFDNTILLKWKQDKTNIDGFKIERKLDEGEWSDVASLANSFTSWTDTLITGGILHEYKLYAYAGENQSDIVTTSLTPIIEANLILGDPTEITTTSLTLNGSVNANGSETTVTFLYKSESEPEWQSVNASTKSFSGNSWVPVNASIAGLTPGVTYQFKLMAVSTAGEIVTDIKSVTLGCNEALAELVSAEKISETSFHLRGRVNANGATAEVTFEYGETPDLGQNIVPTNATVAGNSSIEVNATLKGLKANTIYYYRIKAKNCGGTVYSSSSEFGEQCEKPGAKTSAATNLTSVGAKLNANINAKGKSTTVTFEYGKTENLGQSLVANQSPVVTTNDINVSASLSDLEPCAKYYFRVKAVSCGGTQYSSISSFETSGVEATSTVLAATEIKSNSARLNGKVIANGSSTKVTFQYGENQEYKNVLNATPATVAGSSSENVTINISDLKPCTTYYYRIKTENCSGTTYSSGATFKTTGTKPIVEIQPAGNVTPFSAKLNGRVNALGALTSVIFEYGKSTDMENSVISNPSTVKGNGLTQVSANIKGLDPDSKYYFSIKAVNCGEVVSSNTQEFQTPTAFTVTPSQSNVDYKSGETTFKVDANDSWNFEISKGNEWMEASKKGKSEIKVSYSANPTTSAREGKIKVSSSGKDITVSVIQAGAPCNFDVSPNSKTVPTFSFFGTGFTSFQVEACVKWSVKDDAKWLKAEKADNSTIRVSFDSNFGKETRTAKITVKGEHGLEEVVTVIQPAYSR